jgi:hypothetical protein
MKKVISKILTALGLITLVSILGFISFLIYAFVTEGADYKAEEE